MSAWNPLTPSTPQRLAVGIAIGMTDTGTVRESNQDNFLIDTELGLAAVADGMGGHEGGEVASAKALTALAHALRAAAPDIATNGFGPVVPNPAMAILGAAVEYANQQVYEANLAGGRGDGSGMGTTLTGIWCPDPDGPLLVFHVGDTRLYRWRGGQLVQLTRDQTMYQQAVDAGFRYNLPPRNLLLQALGPGPAIEPELLADAVEPGDLYLLCSDGLHGACTDERIASILARATPDTLAECCAGLIDSAKADGSRDNITALLVDCTA